MILALSAFSANAKHHAIDCSTCTADACGKGASKEMLKGCADCPGTEVFDCGTAAFDAQNCDKLKGKAFTAKSECKSASKMIAKAGFQAYLKAKEGNAEAQKVMDGFKALDEGNLGASADATE